MSKENEEIKRLDDYANRIRIKVIKLLSKTVGHVGGSMSIAEILAVLYFHEMNIDAKDPDYADRDRLVLSKGHGCPALYSALMEVGYLSEDLLTEMHATNGPLQGHPDMITCPGIDMSSGALGQGISAALGMALGAKLKKKDFRVYSILGCGECNEGQVWEAAMFASQFKLDNLVAFVDYNKFALSDKTDVIMSIEPLADKWASFGWHVIEIDGHSVAQIIEALDKAKTVKGKPTIIIANTIKARKVSCYENLAKSHSVGMTPEQVENTLKELGCPDEEIAQTLSHIKEDH
ncbi:MAG: transketolase [Planctomycetota bacterium]|jgi:transketolase